MYLYAPRGLSIASQFARPSIPMDQRRSHPAIDIASAIRAGGPVELPDGHSIAAMTRGPAAIMRSHNFHFHPPGPALLPRLLSDGVGQGGR